MKKNLKKFLPALLTIILLMSLTFASGESAQPIELTSLDPFDKSDTRVDGILLDGWDKWGGTYTTSLAAKGTTSFIEYLLNGKYGRLEATLYVTGANISHWQDYSWDFATCKIYADDRLLFSQTGFTLKTEPLALDLDVSGVRFLRIEFENAAYFSTGAGRPLILLGNPMLYP